MTDSALANAATLDAAETVSVPSGPGGTIVSASPFLPGTKVQWAWDATSLTWIKTCPRLYQYKMIEGWTSGDENVHLRFGIEYHQALQGYELERAAGIPHDDAVHDVVRELLIRTADWKPDHKYKNRSLLVRTVIWYLDQFRDDPATTFIMAEGQPAVEVSFRFELDWGPPADIQIESQRRPIEDWTPSEPLKFQPYLLCGHLDRVVSFNDDLFVMDHKTTTRTPSEWYFKQFEPNNQMTLYTLAGQVIFDAPIKGVIIDSAQIMIEGSRFVRSFTYRTKDQVDEWLGDLKVLLAKAEEYAAANYWPMNDTACVMCEFREICSKSPQVREKFLASEFVKREPWSPLKPR